MRILRVVATAGAAAAVAAGCGGEETVVNVTVTAHTGVSTPTLPTTPTVVTTASVPTTTDGGIGDLEVRLPPPGVIDDMNSGATRHLPKATDMVGALFRAGDPGAADATRRLQAEGYEDGYLRDQSGGTAATSPTLVRTYVFRVRDAATARSEVSVAVQEVKNSSTAQMTDVTVPGAYAEGVRATLGDNRILYVTWASGRDVYGIQVVGRYVHEPDVVKAAEQNHTAWGG